MTKKEDLLEGKRFHQRVWRAFRDYGVLKIDELIDLVHRHDHCSLHNHRQRLRNVCSQMVQMGVLQRVGRGVYRCKSTHKKRPEHFSYNERLLAYVKEYGRVQFKQIAAAFESEGKSEKAVRSALDRMRKLGVVSKDGLYWCWMGNVVTLDKPVETKRVPKDAKEKKRRNEYWPKKPESDDDPSTWDDDDERWSDEYTGGGEQSYTPAFETIVDHIRKLEET